MGVSHRPVVGAGVDLVALLEIEAGGLKAERVKEDVAAPALDRAALRRLQELLPVALPAQCPGDPEDPHVEHAAPDRAQETTQHLLAPVPEEEIDRGVLGQTGHAHVVRVEVVGDRLLEALGGVGIGFDAELGHGRGGLLPDPGPGGRRLARGGEGGKSGALRRLARRRPIG